VSGIFHAGPRCTTRAISYFRDLLHAFVGRNVRFLVVGAYALAVLGRPRATGDLDVWIDATPGREDFIANKRATGRLKDLADVERLQPRRRRMRRR
jgi:hypothetical protein